MAVNHITYNDQLQHGRQLRSAMNKIHEGRDELAELVEIVAQMKDGSTVTSYIQGKFGTTDLSGAEALVAEIESLNFKLNTDDSQSNLNAAITQANAKLG